MNRVSHFEIQADDLKRAQSFYEAVFGWTFQEWKDEHMEYIMIMTAPKDSTEPGINGGLIKRPAKTPPQECGTNAYTCTVQVDDFDATEAKILAAGGVVALPKFPIVGIAWQGYFLDTEGNTFGLHQGDPNAGK